MLEIYAPIVRETHTSFEIAPPTLEGVQRRIRDTMQTYPWLVAEEHGQVSAYSYATTFRARPAYRWCAESALYVCPKHHRRGVGRRIYTALFNVLRAQGIRRVVAGISLPNEASVGLHESMGFRQVGVFERIGFKLGRWIDVGLWQLSLGDNAVPSEFIPLRDFPDCEVERILDEDDSA